jgi:hypothetical protein
VVADLAFTAFRSCPELILFEDTRILWAMDLFALLDRCGYRVAARTRLNVMLTLG